MEANLKAQSVIRGKRSKRQRLLSPISMAVPISSSSSTTTTETRCRTEEEDMAHCLILLSQGPTQKPKLELPVSGTPRFGDFKVVRGEGLFSYRCRTCDRCFPCFQALGGHRASHKINSKTEQNRASKQNRTATPTMAATALTLRTPNRVDDSIKPKVHECVVCGAEFASGQALGGHMRRHKAIPVPTKTTTSSSTSLDTDGDVFNPKQMELDLNHPPAPEDYRREPNFSFPPAMFPLVNCCHH